MNPQTISDALTSPVRVQRKRTKGWKMPPNTVYVGRPTKWGNPWEIDRWGRAESLRLYEAAVKRWGTHWPLGSLDVKWSPPSDIVIREELAGKNLACWCPLDEPCHADVLLEMANE